MKSDKELMMRKTRLSMVFYLSLTMFCFLSATAQAIDLADSRFIDSRHSKKISMDFKGAPLEDVLKIFSQQSKLNFIASEDIENKVISLYLDNVPVEEALERILQANNLTYELVAGSDIFIVKKIQKPAKELVTRIYHLRYASVNSSEIKTTFTIIEQGEDGSSSEGSSRSQSSSGTESDTGIVEIVESILSADGTVVEDPRTNSLIVTDLATQFPVIEQTIARLDIPTVQVLIEVEMLDISKTVGDQMGIRYGAQPLTFSGGTRSHIYPWNQNSMLNKGRFAFDGDEFTTGTIDASGLSGVLEFLKSQSDTKNLARPRILTLDNQKAEIKISTDEAISANTVTSSSNSIASQTTEAERTETGVFLVVTPQVNVETGEITMALAPKVIEARTGETFDGQTFRDPEERGTKSIMRVKSGETIVLGGLIRSDSTKTVTKLPFLGDLPFIGGAFRHNDSSVEERELIIFITPHILSDQTLPRMANSDAPGIIREQDNPNRREKEINRTLAIFDNKRFN